MQKILRFVLLILFGLLISIPVYQQNNDIEEAYNKEIALADEAFEAEEYQKAQKHYRKALKIKPHAKYPRYRLEDSITLEEMKRQREAKKDKEKLEDRENAYENAIIRGDQNFKKEQYNIAKDAYLEALTIKHWEQYPKDQIKKINQILFLSELERKYRNAVDMADMLFDAEQYYKSREKYNEALEIKPKEEYPKKQLQRITNILEYQKRLKDYNEIIVKADKNYYDKQYKQAKTQYRKALTIFDKQYPKEQIKKINDILSEFHQGYGYEIAIEKADKLFSQQKYLDAKKSYNDALNIKPGEPYPKSQIDKIEAILAQQNKLAKYNRIIKEADQFFEDIMLTKAQFKYKEALEVLPAKQYPKGQLEKIEKLLDLQNVEIVYNSIIWKADSLFKAKKYLSSKSKYEDALEVIPGKKYPKNQIDLLENIIAKEKKYNSTITKADRFFNNKQYQYALIAYNDALNLFNREYPQRQMAKINEILNKPKPVKEEKTGKMPKVEYEEFDLDLSTADSLKIEEYYKKAINKGDHALEAKYYSAARFYFSKAHELKPNEPYPEIQLKKIEKEINSIMNSLGNKSYQDLINRADRAFKDGYYAIAEYYYLFALSVKPNEEYPRKKLKEIKEMIPAKKEQ